MSGALKKRKDGMVNISLDPEAVALLDELGPPLEQQFGFKPTRSQILRYVLKKASEVH